MARATLIACGTGLVGAWAAVAAVGDLRHGAFPLFALLYGAAAGLYLLALLAVRRLEGPAETPGLLVVVAVVGLVARGMLLPVEPSLSDDAWRYRWEGRAQLSGVDPYTHAPDDPLLTPLRDGEWLRVNHRQVPAVYGPPLELLFAGLAALPGRLLPFKLAFVLADLAIAGLLLRLLRRRGRSSLWVLAWLWHPLPILELAGQAHLEAIPVALLLLAVEREEAGRPRAAAVALGLAASAKYLPLLLIPGFVRRGGRAGAAARLGWALGAGLLPALPYLGGLVSSRGVATYASTWRFNEGPFGWLQAALWESGLAPAFARAAGPLCGAAAADPAQDWAWSQALAKLLVGALVLAALARAAWRGASPARSAALAGALFLALSPTVHPWYALWALPFALLGELGPAWLLLSLSLPLAYEVLLRHDGTPGSWSEAGWVRACIWAPWAILLLASAAARGRLSGARQAARSTGEPPCAVGSCSCSSSP